MAEVIAAHTELEWESETGRSFCACGVELCATSTPIRTQHRKLYAHVAEELAKAGYGNVQAALLAAADEMPIENMRGRISKATAWLRQRAHSLDPEGHALVRSEERRVGKECPV